MPTGNTLESKRDYGRQAGRNRVVKANCIEIGVGIRGAGDGPEIAIRGSCLGDRERCRISDVGGVRSRFDKDAAASGQEVVVGRSHTYLPEPDDIECHGGGVHAAAHWPLTPREVVYEPRSY